MFGFGRTDVSILEERLAAAQSQRAEAERTREEALRDLAEVRVRMATLEHALAETRKAYYDAIGRYDPDQMAAARGGQ